MTSIEKRVLLGIKYDPIILRVCCIDQALCTKVYCLEALTINHILDSYISRAPSSGNRAGAVTAPRAKSNNVARARGHIWLFEFDGSQFFFREGLLRFFLFHKKTFHLI